MDRVAIGESRVRMIKFYGDYNIVGNHGGNNNNCRIQCGVIFDRRPCDRTGTSVVRVRRSDLS